MIKTSIAMSALALSVLLAPGASASCGKVAMRLSALMPEAQAANARVNPAVDPSRSGDDPGPSVGPGRIAGLWSSNVLLDGQVIFQAFEAFTGEGLEFLNDNGSPIEGNVCFGTWTVAAKNTITVYHPAWNYDASGNLIGTVIIKEQITLNPGGNTFKGTVVVDTFDLNGNVAAPELQADITGTRVRNS